MNKTGTLYLFIGYPGAGKTTVAKIIEDYTHAKHIWADIERHRMFETPTHSQKESDELYEVLNQATAYLLSQGKSVIFDTNFSHLKDRQHLSQIASQNNAKVVIIWVNTPLNVAKERAMKHMSRNNYAMNMSEKRFDDIVSKIEEPTDDENPVIINGTNIKAEEIIKILNL
jgi:predicted kinase